MLIIKALQFAAERHQGQIRKVSGLPYVTHPIIVSELLRKYKTSKVLSQLIVAALLHDVLEDTDTTLTEISNKFGSMVAGLVLELTSDKEEIQKIGKNKYLKKKMLSMTSYALVIKLVDRLSNILDKPTQNYCKDTLGLISYIERKRKILSKTHKKIIKDIRKECLQNI
jgi:(p)ppGpp synthase/HD superfamily hydrolase